MSDPLAAVVPEARWMDLDPLEFERLRHLVRENAGRSDQGLLTLSHRAAAVKLGGVEAGVEITGIRLLGLLLFGKEPSLRHFVPCHEVSCEGEALRGGVLRILDELKGRDVPEAVVKALGEALARRDYSRPGAVRVEGTEVLGDEGVLGGELHPLLAEALRRTGVLGSGGTV